MELVKTLGRLDAMNHVELAMYIKDLGISGIQRNSTYCPVANLLRHEIPWVNAAIVGPTLISVYPSKEWFKGSSISCGLAAKNFPNIVRLIQDFDMGKFPFLIAPE